MTEELRRLGKTTLQATGTRNLMIYLPVSLVEFFQLKARDLALFLYDKKQDRLILKFSKPKEIKSHAKKA